MKLDIRLEYFFACVKGVRIIDRGSGYRMCFLQEPDLEIKNIHYLKDGWHPHLWKEYR